MKAEILLCVFVSVSLVQGIDLLEDLISFKEELINGIFGGINDLGEGVFGKGKCGCPCRDYYVPKCEIEYVEQCYNEHYEQVCKSVPVPVVRQAQEIDCQKCRKIKVPVPKTKWVKECNPIYDEKCHTEYHQHCKEETRCHVIYQTICDNSGYQQHCESQPRQHCYPETKCHRTPDTQCVPVQKEKCNKVPVETTEYVEQSQCLPFELDLAQLSAHHHGDPCAGYQDISQAHGHDHGSSLDLSGGYAAPQDHGHAHDHGASTFNTGYVVSPQIHSGGYLQDSYATHNVVIPPNTGYVYQAGYSDQLQPSTVTNGNYAQQIPVYTGNAFGIQDPIIQHQPVISNQYNTKRESIPQHVTGTGNDNPFLSNRQPKSITATIRTNHRNDDDGTKGWIPIPYPLYK